MSSIKDPLPSSWYYTLWLCDTFLSFSGAFLALSDAKHYADDILPPGLEKISEGLGATMRGRILIHTQAAFFAITGVFAFLLYPLIKKHLSHVPEVQEKFVKTIVGTFLAADIFLFYVEFTYIPSSLLFDPSQWTFVLWNKVFIMPALIVMRSSYLAGMGRKPLKLVAKNR